MHGDKKFDASGLPKNIFIDFNFLIYITITIMNCMYCDIYED